jgi:hypothetical protein
MELLEFRESECNTKSFISYQLDKIWYIYM